MSENKVYIVGFELPTLPIESECSEPPDSYRDELNARNLCLKIKFTLWNLNCRLFRLNRNALNLPIAIGMS